MAFHAYKYKLNPTTRQLTQLAQFAGSTRWLWNYMLDANIHEYQTNKKFIFKYELNRMIPELKKQHEWLKQVPSQALQNVGFRLDVALNMVFRKQFGFPKSFSLDATLIYAFFNNIIHAG